ncbi:ACP S-malonyltransferase [Streptomyces sp. NPDC017095]|uniref:ACP S-malonyltransferase n=1 Tax=Streptomyces sp. NPDC017095 TaxID=3364977 RepID=UPI003792B325
MIAVLFPGQGAQRPGMGAELLGRYSDLVAEARDILGYAVDRLCLDDPDGLLGSTRWTQPALYVVSALAYRAWCEGHEGPPDFAAGHSLGEYNALEAAGAFDFATGLRLVARRAELMSRAPAGGMAVVVGLAADRVAGVLGDAGLDDVDIANHNTPTQYVISGPARSLARAETWFGRAGARLYSRLNVSGPFHSRYMRQAERELAAHVRAAALSAPRFPVVSNVTALPHGPDPSACLLRQLSAPVRWTQSVRYLLAAGVTVFRQVGPGNALDAMVRDIRSAGSADPADTVAPLVAHVERDLLRRLREVARVPGPAPAPDTDLGAYGIDLATLVGLSAELCAALGLDVPPAVLYRHRTVRGLAGHLAGAYPERLAERYDEARRRPENHPLRHTPGPAPAPTPSGAGPAALAAQRPGTAAPVWGADSVPVRPGDSVPVRAAGSVPVRPGDSVPGRAAGSVPVRGADSVPVWPGDSVPVQAADSVPVRAAGSVPIRPGDSEPVQAADSAPVRPANVVPAAPATSPPVPPAAALPVRAAGTDPAPPTDTVTGLPTGTAMGLPADTVTGLPVGSALHSPTVPAPVRPASGAPAAPATAPPGLPATALPVPASGTNPAPPTDSATAPPTGTVTGLPVGSVLHPPAVPAPVRPASCAPAAPATPPPGLPSLSTPASPAVSGAGLPATPVPGLPADAVPASASPPASPATPPPVPSAAAVPGPSSAAVPVPTSSVVPVVPVTPPPVAPTTAFPAPPAPVPPVDTVTDLPTGSAHHPPTAPAPVRSASTAQAAPAAAQPAPPSDTDPAPPTDTVMGLPTGSAHHPPTAPAPVRPASGAPAGPAAPPPSPVDPVSPAGSGPGLPGSPAPGPPVGAVTGAAAECGGASRWCAGRRDPAEPIAVVGMSGLLPGADDLDGFWRNLMAGQDVIRRVPEDRWDWRAPYGRPGDVDARHVPWGAFLRAPASFDCAFFGIPPREAELMDPQQRLLLQTAWRAMEDAGHQLEGPAARRTGVFVGVSAMDYFEVLTTAGLPMEPYLVTGLAHALLANRISYWLGLNGPSEAVDTACSSSLAALHRAMSSIRQGDCDQALVGGVNVLAGPGTYISLTKAGMLAPDGRCKSFDERADGYVRGEGVVALLVRPLSDARRDGDHVHAVLRGSAVNHSGRTVTLTAPDPDAQAEVVATAWRASGLDPSTAGLIEAHGTGTALGDPIEIEGLRRAFEGLYADWGLPRPRRRHLAVGAVKSHIGHLEAAAGMAGLVTVLLAMRHGTLPGLARFRAPNPLLRLGDGPLRLLTRAEPWERPRDAQGRELPRRAGISSFGFGGANAHVVVEEYVEDGPAPLTPKTPYAASAASSDTPRTCADPPTSKTASVTGDRLVPLSARSADRLRARAEQLTEWLACHPAEEYAFDDLVATLRTGRRPMEHRLAVVAPDATGLRARLEHFLRDGHADGVWTTDATAAPAGPSHDRADEDRVRALAERADLAGLARLWTAGAELDWSLLGTQRPHRRLPLPTYPFTHRVLWPVAAPAAAAPADAAPPGSPGPLADAAPPGAPAGHRRERIAEHLVQVLTETLGRRPAGLDQDTGFDRLGLDSLATQQVRARLERTYGELPATLVFTHKNIRSLSAYLAGRHPTAGPTTLPTEPTPTTGPPAPVPHSSASYTHPTAPGSGSSASVRDDDIAIVGMSGRYPHARSVAEFWRNLAEGRDCVDEMPLDRPGFRRYAQAARRRYGDAWHRWGGWLDDVDAFDAPFFRLSPVQARYLDPQQRLFLEVAWECVEDAGYTPDTLADPAAGDQRGAVGVFAGVTYNSYQLFGSAALERGEWLAVETQTFSVANRVSYLMNLGGPSLTVDTACSSSLYAVHLACESIRRGECRAAIAGGVNLSLHPVKYMTLAETGFLSSDGRCRAFGEGGDGYVPAEAVGAVLLKPLGQALRDGDTVHAVVKGSAVNSDGRTFGYTVPNPVAQAEVIRAALRSADVEAATIGCLEAHGTGTALGDPVEVRGLCDAFADVTARQSCAVGSVKSLIGHAEAAAGIAQLTKAVLQLKHRRLVPTLLHSARTNPDIAFEETPFRVQLEAAPWEPPPGGRPRRAGISSFGAGGVNVHLIVEEAPEVSRAAPAERRHVLVLSAAGAANLREYAVRLRRFLADAVAEPEPEPGATTGSGARTLLPDTAFTLQTGRAHLAHRLALSASRPAEAVALLDAHLAGAGGPRVHTGVVAHPASGDRHRPPAGRDPDDLARAWAAGTDWDWTALHDGRDRPRRISLPTYPFSRHRYWLHDPTGTSGAGTSTENAGRAGASGAGSRAEKAAPAVTAPGPETPVYDGETPASGPETPASDGEAPASDGEASAESAVPATPPARDGVPVPDAESADRAGGGLLGVLRAAPPSERLALLTGWLRAELGHLLQYDPEEPPDPDTGFFDLGLDSVLAVRLGTRIEQELGVELYATVAFDHPSVGALASYLLPLPDLGTPGTATVPAPGDGQRPPRHRTVHFTADWEPDPSVPAVPAVPDDSVGPWASGAVVLDADDAVARLLRDRLRAHGCPAPVVLVRPGTEYARVHAGEYRLRPGDTGDWDRLVDSLDADADAGGTERPGVFVHLWTAAGAGQDVRRRLDLGVRSLFRLARRLLPAARDRTVRVLQVDAHPAGRPDPLAEALSGFARSLRHENPRLLVQAVAVDAARGDARPDPQEVVRVCTAELRGPGLEAEVRYQGGRRLVRRVRELPPRARAAAPGPVVPGGVYVVTGGAGGLGLLFAEHLARRAPGARLVLGGRAEPGPERAAAVRRIAGLGADVEYVRADVAEEAGARRLIERARDRHGRIDGLIHSAGCVRDALLADKTGRDLDEVLAGKVLGAFHLDALTRDDDLDFFLAFSSLTALIGNPGQTDYAYANRFLCAFARHRERLRLAGERRGRSIALVWPSWRHGGMRADARTEEVLLSRVGLTLLETPVGVDAFERALSGGESEFGVAHADPRLLRRVLDVLPPRADGAVEDVHRELRTVLEELGL